ncbi:MAG TPA: alpha/beta fold hydrolase [Phycisphaerae bacterium]|nr:alpha/beta fold hydrolase [Phycisphaerae bacterium]
MGRSLTLLEEYLVADYERRISLLKDTKTKAAVEKWMGPAAFRELMGQLPDTHYLSAGPKNIVFAPGIMGSTLQSIGLGGVWWIDIAQARDKLDQLRLKDDGTGDVDELAEIMPGAVDLSYEPFRRALASAGIFGGSVQFPYDWRKSLRASADAMRDVILKTHADYGKKVHLVGHSMGGLMIRTALMIHGQQLWPKIDKIVYIGTPHFGSPSIAGYLKNHLWGWEQLAIVGMFLSRETFRTMRGALSLLPAPAGVYPGTRNGEKHPCANFDLYKASDWKLEIKADATVRLQVILDEVRQFYTDLYNWHDDLLQEYKDKMLMIAGVGQDGLFRLEFDTILWGSWERTKKITARQKCDVNYEGDGRVPLASAQIEDVTTRYVEGEHGGLPNIPAVAQDVLAWLTGGNLNLSTTCQDALGGHLSAVDLALQSPLLSGSGVPNRFRDLPEYENPTPDFRKKIEKDLDDGKIPQINLVKIL